MFVHHNIDQFHSDLLQSMPLQKSTHADVLHFLDKNDWNTSSRINYVKDLSQEASSYDVNDIVELLSRYNLPTDLEGKFDSYINCIIPNSNAEYRKTLPFVQRIQAWFQNFFVYSEYRLSFVFNEGLLIDIGIYEYIVAP